TILAAIRPGRPVEVLARDAAGLSLAEDVRTDRDLPPFDRATMDGYAIRARDLRARSAIFRVAGDIPAGRARRAPLSRDEAAGIMTGAPLPPGADAVVMVERSAPAGRGRVRLQGPARAGQAVARRGEDLRRGERLLERGRAIGPAEIGILAMAGRVRALVFPPPAASYLSTGDEIVPAGRSPGAVQIRDANAPIVAAFLSRAGLRRARSLGIARDRPGDLRRKLARALEGGAAIITGGVSKGRRDIVRPTLEALGVRIIVHGVAVKPGKPILFGIARSGCLVFGLPGNPVSVLAGLEVFVAPALRKRMGLAPLAPVLRARLRRPVAHQPGRTEFRLARIAPSGDRLVADAIPSHSSGDLAAVARANGFIRIPAAARRIAAGSIVEARFFR
ncbi:MAG: molybdopterin molybdotransferase MoeA, partial [Planctomycetes bacterium]|nr:molybdopterin molybdotransferase MoeA [Planctomycetota bacterium]